MNVLGSGRGFKASSLSIPTLQGTRIPFTAAVFA